MNEKEIEKLVIKSCKNEILDIINKEIKKGIIPFKAIDIAFEEYNLEEEIILKYDLEVERENSGNPKNLELTNKQIEDYKEKIQNLVYNQFINQISKNLKKNT